MSSLRRRFSGILSWAMIPLALLSGMPRIGCLCANGEFKSLCERQLSHCCGVHLPGTDATECACCLHAAVPVQQCSGTDHVASQPRSKAHGCCSSHRDGTRPTGSHLSQTRCCTPIVTAPTVPTVAKAATIAGQPSELMPTLFDVAPLVLVPAPLRHDVGRAPDLPVVDLLIAHQIFLI